MAKAIKIAPSILSADFARLGEQIEAAQQGGADEIHVDVMDGHYVPNITVGPVVIKSIRRVVTVPLVAHLMISDADRYLESFAETGVDELIVHVEACLHIHRTLDSIHRLGLRAGVALNPGTPAAALSEILADIDSVLVMTVNPGFGGQTLIERTLDKVVQVRGLLDQVNPVADIAVDGGIEVSNAGRMAAAGANILIAGTAVFTAPAGIGAAIANLRQAAQTRSVIN